MPTMMDSLRGLFRRRRVGPTETAGVHGFNIVGGYLTPEEIEKKLTGQEKYKTYANLLANVSIVGASVRYFLNLIARSQWKFEAAEADTDGRFAELAEAILTDDPATPWHRVVRRSAMYRMYGFSFQEWTARRHEDGHLTLADIAPRPQKTIERWDVNAEGKVQGVVQRDPIGQQELYLPRAKLCYLVDDTLSDSPDGLGILRHLATPGEQLSRFEQLEGFGYETDLRGIPIGRAPLAELRDAVEQGRMSESERQTLEKHIRNFITNHIKQPNQGLLLDSMTYQTIDDKGTPSSIPKWDLKLLTGGSTGHEAIAKAIDRKSREIARLLGTESLLLGDGEGGSRALSRDKTQNLWLMVDGSLLELAEAYDQDLLDPVWKLNGWPDEMKPSMSHESVQFKDIDQITAALNDMAKAGAQLAPDDPAIEEVRTLLGLSPPVPYEVKDPDLDLSGTGEQARGTGDQQLPGGPGDQSGGGGGDGNGTD